MKQIYFYLIVLFAISFSTVSSTEYEYECDADVLASDNRCVFVCLDCEYCGPHNIERSVCEEPYCRI